MRAAAAREGHAAIVTMLLDRGANSIRSSAALPSPSTPRSGSAQRSSSSRTIPHVPFARRYDERAAVPGHGSVHIDAGIEKFRHGRHVATLGRFDETDTQRSTGSLSAGLSARAGGRPGLADDRDSLNRRDSATIGTPRNRR
jgi:hypothetical protein